MRVKRIVIVVLQLCVLIALILMLYRTYVHKQPAPTALVGDNDEDDQKYVPIVPVSIGPVVRTSLRSYLDAYGVVEPQPARHGLPAGGAAINSPAPALVQSVEVVEGQQVKAGQTLFKLDDRVVLAAIAKAKQDVESTARIAEEFDDALQSKAVPQAQVLRAHAARDAAKSVLAAAEAQQALLTLTAPIDGIAAQVRIHAGESTPLNLPAVELVNPARLVVALQVPQWQLADLKVGDGVILNHTNPAVTAPSTQPTSQAAAQPTSQPAADAVVIYIDPAVDPRTGLAQVDIALPHDSGYRVGQFVSLQIITGQHDNILAVPVTSIVQDGKGNPALSVVLRDYHWAFRRTVQLGYRDNGMVEVINSDLKAGQSVVTTGSYSLSDQCQIVVNP